MSRWNKALIALLLVLALLAASCELFDGPASRKGEGSGVSVSIPAISPAFSEFLNGAAPSSKGLAPRVYLASDRVVLRLVAQDSSLVDELTMERDPRFLFTSLDGTIIAPPGAGYTVEAEVFNLEVSASVPVVSGVSAPFDITAGVITEVGIVCLPHAPAPLTLGATNQVNLSPTLYDMDAFTITMGGEAWYSFTATGPSTTIRAIPAVPEQSGFNIGLMEADGASLGGLSPMAEGDIVFDPADGSYSLDLATTVGAQYFVGVLSMDFISGGENLLVSGPFEFVVQQGFSADYDIAIVGDASGVAWGPLQDAGGSLRYFLSQGDADATIAIATTAEVSFDGGVSVDADKNLSLAGFSSGDIVEVVLTDANGSLSLSLELAKATELTAGTASILSLSGGVSAYARMTVSPGADYEVVLEDYWDQGGSSYTADALMDCYGSDGTQLLSDVDSCYSLPESLSVPASGVDGLMFIVRKYFSFGADGTAGLTVSVAP